MRESSKASKPHSYGDSFFRRPARRGPIRNRAPIKHRRRCRADDPRKIRIGRYFVAWSVFPPLAGGRQRAPGESARFDQRVAKSDSPKTPRELNAKNQINRMAYFATNRPFGAIKKPAFRELT